MSPGRIAVAGRAASLMFVAMTGAGGSIAVAQTVDRAPLERQVPRTEAEVLLSYAPVAKKVTPAVVNIYAKRKVADAGYRAFAGDPFFQQFFGRGAMPRERMVGSLGSGVIVDAKGTIVTSNHVVEGGEGIVVVLSDGREMPAKIDLADPSTDLAILTVESKGKPLPALSFADSDALQVGDLVLAVGNPFGVGQTVTSGIVSALARPAAGVSDYQFFIQTDAAINPGNSGGALTDMKGRLIGINTAIYSKTGASNGIGFAIPSNMVAALLRNRQPGGALLKPWLGASYESVTSEQANALGLSEPRGALVGEMFASGPAKGAGLMPGDVVTKLGEADIPNAETLKFRIALSPLDTPVKIAIWRKGAPVEKTIRFAAPPEIPARDTRVLTGAHPLRGITVANLSPRVAADYALSPMEDGVVITKGGSGDALRPGDRIAAVNGTKIASARQLESVLKKRVRGWKIVLVRAGEAVTYTVVP